MPMTIGSGGFTGTTPPEKETPRSSSTGGRLIREGPRLLKERRYLRQYAAEQLWKSLQTQGWKPMKTPEWGVSAEEP